jgi:hypothetical protein
VPRRAIVSENRVGEGGNRFPKLDFKEKGERKRVLLIDPEGPWQEYVHYLRAPKFKDGQPVMTTRERRGEEVPDYDTDFIGMPLCYGDAETVAEQGYDAKNCPACATVPNAPSEMRLAPQLRFAANVVDQVLKGGSWEIRRPFSASVVLWTFTSGMYDEILSLQEQHGALIRERDITLECSNAKFNQVKMGVMNVPGWQEANAGAVLKELLETPGNVATEEQLRDACGRTVKRNFMEEDVRLCLKRWEKALRLNGVELGDPAGTANLGGQPQQTLASAAQELLGNGQPQDTSGAVAAVQAAKAEVRAELGLDNGGLGSSGLDIFTPGGDDRAMEANAAVQEQKHGADVDPFGGGAAPGSPTGPASGDSTASTPSAQSSPSEAAPAEPAAEAEKPAKSRFDSLLAGLGGG